MSYSLANIQWVLENYWTFAGNKYPPNDGVPGRASFIGDGLDAIVHKIDIDCSLQSMGGWYPAPNNDDEIRARVPRFPRHMKAVIECFVLKTANDWEAVDVGLRTMRDFLRGFCSIRRKLVKQGNSRMVSIPKKWIQGNELIVTPTADGVMLRFVRTPSAQT